MFTLKIVGRASVLFCLFAALPLYAVRRPDVPSSGNGIGPYSSCPNSMATPFFATLDGTWYPPAGCIPTSDPNKPNPPSPYPNLKFVLSGTGFTVTVTPALWERGDGQIPVGLSKATVFMVEFSGAAGMTLQSLVIGAQLNNAAYTLCDPNFPDAMPFCISDSSFLLYDDGNPIAALEPAAIDLADATTTRWDFTQFVPGSTLFLVVGGFPSQFSTIDKYPNSNALTVASFASANFLATVKDGSTTLTAGGLTLQKAAKAKNDLIANQITITDVPFTSFINTSATKPTEILSGTDAGDQQASQGDPAPEDPAIANAGTPCDRTWSAGASRVFRSVWYKFTPSTSNNYAISTANSRYDTGIYVFTGTKSSPTPVACNDDASTSAYFSLDSSFVNFAATAGTTYHIMVSEAPPPVGTDVTGTIPLAAPLAVNATLQFSVTVGSGIMLAPNTVLNFPVQAVGTTSSPLTITATNNTSATVDISGVTIIKSGAKDFSKTNNCGASLGPGLQCTITVTFTPLAEGPHTASLSLNVTGGASPTPITLNGYGD